MSEGDNSIAALDREDVEAAIAYLSNKYTAPYVPFYRRIEMFARVADALAEHLAQRNEIGDYSHGCGIRD